MIWQLLVCSGSIATNMYAHGLVEGKRITLHRFIMNPDKDSVIDHKDRNGLNCQKSNLRICTKQENNWNCKTQGRSKTSQYKGVSFDKRIMKWGTQISINGKIKNLGYYENEKDAAIVYNQNARQLFGEFANLNQL